MTEKTIRERIYIYSTIFIKKHLGIREPVQLKPMLIKGLL